MTYHKLGADGRSVEPATHDEAMALLRDHDKRRVACDERGDVKVSTVFLVIDHGFGGAKPVVFETMIFGGEHDQYQDRYCTYEGAEAGHKAAVALAFGEAGKAGA